MTGPSDSGRSGTGTERARWVVVGGSGFVGSSIVERLRSDGVAVEAVAAPRIDASPAWNDKDVVANLDQFGEEAAYLRSEFAGATVVVNAAGLAVPDGGAQAGLVGANGVLPVLVAKAALEAGASRFVHLSSASVQGRARVLDESATMNPFSPYSRSKALGELSLLAWARATSVGRVVIVRATSVQGPGRRTTANLQRIASSSISSVARPGNQPTPVVSVAALAEFVVLVANHSQPVPTIVLQPWEGMTTASVLAAAGGRAPRLLNGTLCKVLVSAGYLFSRLLGGKLSGLVRRVELMWFGQDQAEGWAQRTASLPQPSIVEVLSSPQRDTAKREARSE